MNQIAVLLSDVFVTIWRNAGIHLRGDLLFHDLITQTLLKSLQPRDGGYGIIDAFVYAHNCNRHNTDNPGKFEDCMEGRTRLLTAITPSCAHAYQALCLTIRRSDIPCKDFACRQPRPNT